MGNNLDGWVLTVRDYVTRVIVGPESRLSGVGSAGRGREVKYFYVDF
jgi:hypothetical protein